MRAARSASASWSWARSKQGGRDVRLPFGHKAHRNAVALLEGPLADPAHNPWLGLAHRHPLRKPATVDDLGGVEALRRARIWQDFYRPFDIGDGIGATLERQPDRADILMVGRRAAEAEFDSASKDLFAALLPHIARAWRVKHMLSEWQAAAGTLKFILDRLERGVVVTDPEGHVRFANGAADRLLSRGDRIDASRGRIRAALPRQTDALLALVGRAAQTGIGADTMALDALAIPGSGHSPPLAVVAEPLAPAHSDKLGHRPEAGAVLFISDSAECTRPSEDRLRVVYDLTAAEARLTALLVDGHDPGSAGRALGISRNTVKYHLKTVYSKVGVCRQADLVRRVLADVGGLAEPQKLQPRSPSLCNEGYRPQGT